MLLAGLLPALVLAAGPGRADPGPAVEPDTDPASVLTFVSVPDLFNADVGDVRPARRGKGWERGDPNSWNGSYRRAVEKVFGTLAAHRPDAVLVAGDVVEGRWGVDSARTGIFGPLRTRSERLRAVRRAGNVYYGAWRSFFRAAGIRPATVHPALGDHEIGDNPWLPGSFKRRAVPTFKAVWARHFTTAFGRGHRFAMRPRGTHFEDTAYARWLAPDVLLVTVDVFRPTRNGIDVGVYAGQLRWLKKVLRAVERRQTVIVQGHTPAIGPVRSRGSSRMFLDGGPESSLWRLLSSSGKVDLYLAGEVHAQTARQDEPKGPVQVTHGGLFGFHGTNYLVGQVHDDGRTELESWDFPTTRHNPEQRLWQTSPKRPPRRVSYGDAVNTGGLTLQDGIVTASYGDLALNPVLGVGELVVRPRS